jgi:hypothetical protein
MDPRIIRPVIAEDELYVLSPSRFTLRDRTPGSMGSTANLDVTDSTVFKKWLVFFTACPLRLKIKVSNSFETSGTTHPPTKRHVPEELYLPRQTLFIHRNNYCGRLRRWDPVSCSVFSHILHSSFHLELGQPLWSVRRHLRRFMFPFPRMPTSPSYYPRHQTLTSPAAQWQQVAKYNFLFFSSPL